MRGSAAHHRLAFKVKPSTKKGKVSLRERPYVGRRRQDTEGSHMLPQATCNGRRDRKSEALRSRSGSCICGTICPFSKTWRKERACSETCVARGGKRIKSGTALAERTFMIAVPRHPAVRLSPRPFIIPGQITADYDACRIIGESESSAQPRVERQDCTRTRYIQNVVKVETVRREFPGLTNYAFSSTETHGILCWTT